MIFGLTFEQFIKIVGGLAAAATGLSWLNHFFASGESRLQDRRKDTDANLLRITTLEKELKELRRHRAYDVEVKHSALLQLNRLSFAYDRQREALLLLCRVAKENDAISPVFCEQYLNSPTSAEVLKDASELIEGLHIAFEEKDSEET